MTLHDAIHEFDGKHIEPLEQFIQQAEITPNIIDQLCEFALDDVPKHQSAATWILRKLVEQGHALTEAQTQQILTLLTDDNTHWEATLHILQMIEHLTIPKTLVDKLSSGLIANLTSKRKMIRAWSYHALVVLGIQFPERREDVSALLFKGEADESASVRARIRQLKKQIDWKSE